MRRGLGFLLSVGLVAGSLFVGLPQASATVPGLNGVIAAIQGNQIKDYLVLIDPVTGEHHSVLRGHYLYDPAWSPDGSRLAVAATSAEVIKVVNSDGSNVTTLSECGYAPAWSPDGKYIVCNGGQGGTYLVAVDGSGTTMIAPEEATAEGPEFTPDGNWIVFVRYTEGQRDIWKMRPDGSETTRLTDLATTNPGMQAQDPLSVSPNGSDIAFNLVRDIDNHWQIGTVPLAGGSPVQVTTGSQYTAYPTWSSDGQWIAAVRQGLGLVKFRPDGSDLSALPYAKGTRPAWQPASVTVRSSRSVVDAGSTLTLTMRLAWPGENNAIQLQSHRPGDTWRNVKTLSVDSSGIVKVPVTVRANTWFRTKWSGDSGHPSATSAPTYVEARLVLTAGLKRSYDRNGRVYLYHAKRGVVFLAHLNPPKPDDKVCFTTQFRKGASYRTFDVTCYKTYDKGRLAGIIWTFQNPGNSYRIRATWEPTTQRPKDLDNLADTTKWSYFRVTR